MLKPGDEDIHTANERRLKVLSVILWFTQFMIILDFKPVHKKDCVYFHVLFPGDHSCNHHSCNHYQKKSPSVNV